MDRRIFLANLLALPCATTSFAAQPWSAKFILGGFDGKAYAAGLHITLASGWKTYWRNPGEAGIPPSIKISGDNIASATFDFPLPQRLSDESGEAFGYHNEVLFPIVITPIDSSKPVQAHISAFFGVCEIVCTPAKLEIDSISDYFSTIKIVEWQKRVPQLNNFVISAKIEEKFLILDLTQPVNDIFVEGPDRYYFTKPDFERESGKAWISIKGLKNSSDLKSVKLRITADAMGQGLEQVITLP
jgi:DsbC/DsbD-like thiol-disulfide interchange protein